MDERNRTGVKVEWRLDFDDKRTLRVHRLLSPAILAILVALATLAACSDPAPTPDTAVTPAPRTIAATPAPPENTPVPEGADQTATQTPMPTPEPTTATPTPESTATKEAPTPAPEPTSTPAPNNRMPTGVLSPLKLDDPMYDDPEAVNAMLSEAELACLKEVGPVMHRRWAWILPGYGDREERVKVIECLEDEILARIYLADIAEGVGPLSLETSTCIRAAFNEIDPRSMMLAKVEGFPDDTLNSATTLHFVTIACLSDEEWETVPTSQEESDLREWMRCMMEKLGGPGEIATAMTVGDEEDQKALAEAAEDCAEEMRPAPRETPASPTATLESASTPEPSSIVPLDPDDSAELLSRLSQDERDCVTDFELLADFWSKHPDVDYEDVAQQMGCLGDETLLNLHLAHLAWYFQDLN